MFAAPKTIETRRAAVQAFVRAYQRGTQAFHDTFLAKGPDGKAVPGPNTDANLAIVAKYTGQSVDSVRASIPYVDPQGRLLVSDIYRQVRWYQGQRLVDGGVDAKSVLDLSFVDGHLDLPK